MHEKQRCSRNTNVSLQDPVSPMNKQFVCCLGFIFPTSSSC